MIARIGSFLVAVIVVAIVLAGSAVVAGLWFRLFLDVAGL